VRQTQKAIKHALTERYYAFEDARRVAVVDPEVDLEAEPGTQAYTPIYSDVSLSNLPLDASIDCCTGNGLGVRLSGSSASE
ncbi:MAG: hypothetical protein Q9180_009272, partial [Flavoplaca navasiana]